ncbi:MAG TPA: glycosyltransferase family 9 protein [Pseudonocardia sp.]|jgi:ADP-heptose:LPS heptosyltransferase|uniref:glycosyltransferase family 9 protein n=1 Tax=Pseudonocardia sp. TaxID=60912 RepID=UPI002ED7F296
MIRVLVARLDSDGDVLLAGPAVRAVAAGCDELTMLVGPGGRAAAELLPGVDRILTWDCPWIANPAPPVDPADIRELVDRLAGFELAGAVALTSFHQSPLPLALLLRLAGVPRVAGASADYPGALLDVRVRPGADLVEDLPEPERALAIAAAAGFRLPPGDAGLLAVRPTPDVSALTGPGRYLVLHPGARVPARRWPAARCRDAVRALAAAGHRVLVTGASSEVALTREVAGSAGADLGGRTGFAELAGVLAGADAVVVGNTGPAHLAAAVGTPVVSLFAPVVPAVRWAPYRVPHVLLGDQGAACRDSRARQCPVPGHPCLNRVTPTDVVNAVTALLDTEVAA